MVLVTKPVGKGLLGSKPIRSCVGSIKRDLVDMKLKYMNGTCLARSRGN
jgi:hypothetical protein